MRRVSLSILASAGLFACVPDTAVGPSPASVRAVASAQPDASVTLVKGEAEADAAPRAAIPDGPPKWKTIPREQNGFYAVLDGLCSQLAAGRVGNGVVVHYGGAHNPMFYDGKRVGAASFIALRDTGLESVGDPVINSPTGLAGASVDDFWIADSTGSRSSEGAILHRYVAGTWKKYEKDQTNLHAWVDGGIIGSLGFAAANGELWVEGSTTKPPPALYADLPYPAIAAFPTGDILLVGRKNWTQNPDAVPIARHWAPGKKITEHALSKLFPESGSTDFLHEVAPDEVYVVRTGRIARWDGTSFRLLAKTRNGEAITRVRRAGPDDLWVLTGASNLQRITASEATTIATPEPVADIDGIDRGGAWIVGKSGKLYKREGDGWKPMPLPVPAFSAGTALKAKAVLVVAPDDVLVTGMYWEKAPGWKDQELHTALFRTKPVKETLRCNEPDPENNNINLGRGFQSWPPMATADCKTPFVVLARRSRAIKNEDDWPRIRAALKGHPELGEVALVDFVSGDRTFVGTKAKDLETATKVVALVGARDRLRPEIVCGDPEPKRTLVVDLTTGTAAAK
jgi:hypothetical protein